MIGLGTIVNTCAVILGGTLGLVVKKGLREEMCDSLMHALGLATIFVGLGGALTGIIKIDGSTLLAGNSMLLILSLVIGTLLGEILNIDFHMEHLGHRIRDAVNMQHNSQFVEGFLANTLVICIGAMAVVGSLQDGLNGDHSMLYTKAVLDAIISMVFASTLGIGVLFAAIPLFFFQGSITLLAKIIAPLLSDALISNISFIGSILIFAVGINLLFNKKIKVANMLPALLIPIFYNILLFCLAYL